MKKTRHIIIQFLVCMLPVCLHSMGGPPAVPELPLETHLWGTEGPGPSGSLSTGSTAPTTTSSTPTPETLTPRSAEITISEELAQTEYIDDKQQQLARVWQLLKKCATSDDLTLVTAALVDLIQARGPTALFTTSDTQGLTPQQSIALIRAGLSCLPVRQVTTAHRVIVDGKFPACNYSVEEFYGSQHTNETGIFIPDLKSAHSVISLSDKPQTIACTNEGDILVAYNQQRADLFRLRTLQEILGQLTKPQS